MTMRLGDTCYKKFPVEALWKTQWKSFFLVSIEGFLFPQKYPEPTFEALDTSVLYLLAEMNVHTTSPVLFHYLIKIVQSVKY